MLRRKKSKQTREMRPRRGLKESAAKEREKRVDGEIERKWCLAYSDRRLVLGAFFGPLSAARGCTWYRDTLLPTRPDTRRAIVTSCCCCCCRRSRLDNVGTGWAARETGPQLPKGKGSVIAEGNRKRPEVTLPRTRPE